jgi:hypothetical protein
MFWDRCPPHPPHTHPPTHHTHTLSDASLDSSPHACSLGDQNADRRAQWFTCALWKSVLSPSPQGNGCMVVVSVARGPARWAGEGRTLRRKRWLAWRGVWPASSWCASPCDASVAKVTPVSTPTNGSAKKREMFFHSLLEPAPH